MVDFCKIKHHYCQSYLVVHYTVKMIITFIEPRHRGSQFLSIHIIASFNARLTYHPLCFRQHCVFISLLVSLIQAIILLSFIDNITKSQYCETLKYCNVFHIIPYTHHIERIPGTIKSHFFGRYNCCLSTKQVSHYICFSNDFLHSSGNV